MKKIKVLLAMTCLCGLLGGCAAAQMGNTPLSDNIQQTAFSQEAPGAPAVDPAKEEAEALEAYAAYGMTFDAKTRILTYKGQRVRYFEDLYPIIWNTPADGMAGMTFFDEKGIVDVHATRDLSVRRENGDGSYDPSGSLTGLAAFSQAEFDARDLEPLKNPATSVASAGEPLTEEEAKALYAPYAAFGLTYDEKKDLLYYDGQQVRRFIDVLSTNGEDPAGGKFQGSITNRWDEGGTVDVSALRDYTKPDADGHGRLIGIEKATQEEFDAATKQGNKLEPSVQFYSGNAATTCAQEG